MPIDPERQVVKRRPTCRAAASVVPAPIVGAIFTIISSVVVAAVIYNAQLVQYPHWQALEIVRSRMNPTGMMLCLACPC